MAIVIVAIVGSALVIGLFVGILRWALNLDSILSVLEETETICMRNKLVYLLTTVLEIAVFL